MQPISVTAGPLASADDNSISELQLLPAAGNLVFNGVAGSANPTSIAALQTPAGAGNLTLTASKIYLSQGGQYVYVTCTDDETARTFTISGLDVNGAGISEVISGSNISVTSTTKLFQVVTSVSVDAATADDVSVGAYSPVTFAVPCRITVTPSGDESTNTYTIKGIDVNGSAVTEVLAGDNITASTSVLTYKTVTSIAIANTPANAIIAGNAQSGSGRWIRMDSFANAQSAVQVDTTGSVNYTVQTSMDDPNDITDPVAQANVTWLSALDTNIVAQSSSKSGVLNATPTWVRLNLNSGSGVATIKIAQFGNAPY